MVDQKVGPYATPYQYTGQELDEKTGLYYYGARYYNPRISQFMSVDPLADEFPGWSPYNYTINNPINMIDPDGRAPEPPDWLHKIMDYFNFGSLQRGTDGEKKQTLNRLHDASNKANEIRNSALDVIESGAKDVGIAADMVEVGALGTTAATGGTSSPVTIPLAGGAEVVGGFALGVEVGVDYFRDGKIDQTGTDIFMNFIFGRSGKLAEDGVKAMNIGGKHAKQTEDAVNSIGQTVNKTAESVITEEVKKRSVDEYDNRILLSFNWTCMVCE